MYTGNPRASEELKQSIRREVRRIAEKMLARVAGNFKICFAALIEQRGAWIEHINCELCDNKNA